MPITKLFFILAAVAGMAAYLAPLSRLTYEEKKRALGLAAGAFPVVGVAAYLLASAMHHEVYEAGDQALAEDGSGLVALSLCLGMTASAILLWGASYLDGQRNYEGLLAAQRDEAYAKIAAQEREQRLVDSRVQLARLEAQGQILAIERDRAKLQADDHRAELERQEQAFLLAYRRYCQRVDRLNQKEESALVDGYRRELGRRSIERFVAQLEGSDNVLVQQILHGAPTIRPTP